MSLFGKGNWTRWAIKPEDLEVFTAFLADKKKLFSASAFAARTVLLSSKDMDTTTGINPPCWPCGDSPFPLEQQTLDKSVHPHVARNLANNEIEEPWVLPEAVVESSGVDLEDDRYWGNRDIHFRLYDERTDVFGFWLVLHQRAGLDDLNALKEHSAAVSNGAPFKTLSSQAKKDITASLTSDGLVDYIARTQAPVIIDFRTGNIWLGTNSKKLVDALKFWLSRNIGVFIERMELTPGELREWASESLRQMVSKDLYAVERLEAWEEIKNATEDEAADEDAGDAMESDEGDDAKPKDDEKKFYINDIATYVPDSGVVVNVGCDAQIALGKPGMSAVLAKRPVDALTVLHGVETAYVGAARCSFFTKIGEGQGTVHLEVSALLNECNYKGLEVDINAAGTQKLDTQVDELGLFPEETDGLADRVNRHWMRYYLQLQWAERLVIDTLCGALTLEPVTPKPRTLGAATREVKVPEGEETSAPWHEDGPAQVSEGTMAAVKKGAKKLKASMQKNLLPGESVTISTPGREGVTIHAKGATVSEVEI